MIVYIGLGNTASFSATGGLHLLKWEAITALWVILFTGAATFIILKLVDKLVGLRVHVEDEDAGLDLTQHGERAYTE